MFQRLLRAGLLAGAFWFAVPVQASITADAVSYLPTTRGLFDAYLVEWLPGNRAQLVGFFGTRGGSVGASGTQRVVTLDAPFTQVLPAGEPDACGEFPDQQQDTLQVAVNQVSGNDRRGSVAIVTLGTLTNLTGCEAGRVTPFGALTDPGTPMNNLALALRPAVTDLVPGVALAGPSEESRALFNPPAADVVTLQAGGLGLFARTGSVRPVAFTADHWLVVTLADGSQHGYARIAVDRRTGAETWLDAEWSGGAPLSVQQVLMVKPAAGAGFGSLRQTTRHWESGLFIGSASPFFIDLYRDGTGARILVDASTGGESRTPITWAYGGGTPASVVQRRLLGGGTVTGERTWVPLANAGRNHFVMEDEVFIDSAGGVSTLFRPRVNFYVDQGAATPPAP